MSWLTLLVSGAVALLTHQKKGVIAETNYDSCTSDCTCSDCEALREHQEGECNQHDCTYCQDEGRECDCSTCEHDRGECNTHECPDCKEQDVDCNCDECKCDRGDCDPHSCDNKVSYKHDCECDECDHDRGDCDLDACHYCHDNDNCGSACRYCTSTEDERDE